VSLAGLDPAAAFAAIANVSVQNLGAADRLLAAGDPTGGWRARGVGF
jgi:hypothetical protein